METNTSPKTTGPGSKWVFCCGRREAERIRPPTNTVLIAITDVDEPVPEYEFLDHYKAYLRLQAQDYDYGQRLSTKLAGYADGAPTEEQIDVIYDFIVRHQDYNVVAHCEAGVSRSGAVREFLERMGWKILIYTTIHPNQIVLQGLIKRQKMEGRIRH